VKKLLRSCTVWRNFSGSPYTSVIPSELPEICVSSDPPLIHTGVDFCESTLCSDQGKFSTF